MKIKIKNIKNIYNKKKRGSEFNSSKIYSNKMLVWMGIKTE